MIFFVELFYHNNATQLLLPTDQFVDDFDGILVDRLLPVRIRRLQYQNQP